MGKRSIVSEWAPEDNGRRERAWWTAPMVSILCCCFRSENSDALLYLKLWYSFYIRVEYQRLPYRPGDKKQLKAHDVTS